MKNVLITSGMSALSQRVSKLLPECQLFFADSNSVSFFKNGKYRAIPTADKSSYVHEVLKICLDLSVDTLIPLGEHELVPLAKSRILFEEYDIMLILPSTEELGQLPTILNPNRQGYPEIVIHVNGETELKMKGVFAKQADGTWGICCAG